jgi:hypothetical protein
MTSRWVAQYEGVPGARAAIEALVREWFEQTLIELVLCARGSRWDARRLELLLSPTSLTAAVMPRFLLDQQIRKRLGQKLGR